MKLVQPIHPRLACHVGCNRSTRRSGEPFRSEQWASGESVRTGSAVELYEHISLSQYTGHTSRLYELESQHLSLEVLTVFTSNQSPQTKPNRLTYNRYDTKGLTAFHPRMTTNRVQLSPVTSRPQTIPAFPSLVLFLTSRTLLLGQKHMTDDFPGHSVSFNRRDSHKSPSDGRQSTCNTT